MLCEKIIVITEFFPPNNCAASNRVFSWANNLSEHGYYPVIFCKNDFNNEEYFIQKKEDYEVHYIKCADPFFQRQRLSAKNILIKKCFGLLHYIFVNSIKYNGVKSMKKYIDQYVRKNKIKKLIVTAPSYSLFGLANKLFKQHKINWIADYRDDWSTSEIFSSKFFKFVGKIDRVKEKKYLRTCSFFTTVSCHYLNKIEKVINKKGYLIENGFSKKDIVHSKSSNTDGLTILYPGSIYFTQNLNLIGECLNILHPAFLEKLKIIFLGTELKAIKLPPNCISFIGKNLLFLKRTDREETLKYYQNADVFLLIAHINRKHQVLKGIPSSKLYEYISLRKKVLVCPSDNDIIQEKLSMTHQGIFCNTPQEMAARIKDLFQIKSENGCVPLADIPKEIFNRNTREFQNKKLAKILDTL